MNGILIVDKPQDFTSFDVAAIVRHKFGTKKVGHGGTLDPMATGVLPVFIGNAAKAVDIMPESGKSYRAGFRLGLTSDTLDIWGKVSEKGSFSVSESELLSVMERFTGDILQTPPMYSAIKINGVKLCDLARQGIVVEREPRKINISRLELLSFDGKDGVFEVDCSSGTYVRSLIDDIGAALGCGAVMSSLRRTRALGFSEELCVSVNDIKTKALEELLPLIPVEKVFGVYPEIRLDERQTRLYTNGVRLDAARLKGEFKKEISHRVYAFDGNFLGLGKINAEEELVSIKRFA